MAPAAGAVTFHYNAYGGFVPGSESGTPPFFNPDYDNENDWYKEPAPNDNSPAPDANHFMDYSWGASTPGNNIGDGLRSGFRLLDTGAVPGGPSTDGEHISGQVTVNGGLVNAGYVTHYNQPNPWEGTGTVEVHWHIDLFDGTPVPGDFSNLVSPIVESTFLLEILETANNAGQCDPNQTAGSVCDDRLQVIAVSPDGTNFTPVDTFTDLELFDFDYMGTNYKVLMSGFFEDQDLTQLAGEFWSAEGGNNTAYVGFRLVPEPASAALMGLGLAGLAGMRRRRGPRG